MIIKIEGLQDGQKIQHINVDITFEENGDITINKKIDREPAIPKLADAEPEPEIVEKPEIENKSRKKKEIPKEMKDQEY